MLMLFFYSSILSDYCYRLPKIKWHQKAHTNYIMRYYSQCCTAKTQQCNGSDLQPQAGLQWHWL